MNKVDLVEKKKQLLKVAEEFEDLPGYERYGSLVKEGGIDNLEYWLQPDLQIN